MLVTRKNRPFGAAYDRYLSSSRLASYVESLKRANPSESTRRRELQLTPNQRREIEIHAERRIARSDDPLS